MVDRIILTEQDAVDTFGISKGQPQNPKVYGEGINLDELTPINAMTNFSGQGSFRVNMSLDERGNAHGASPFPGMSNTKTTHFSTADLMNERFDGSVLSTAHLSGGIPATEVFDNTLVIVNGMETTAEAAAHMGLLRKEGGRYVEARSIPQSTPQANPQQAGNLEGKSDVTSNLGQETEQVIESYYRGMGKTGAENLMNSVLSGSADRSVIEGAAVSTGKTPDQVKADVENIQQMLIAEGCSYMKSQNPDIDPGQVLKFVFERMDRADLQDTLRQHWNGKLTAWKGMLEAYLDYNVPQKSFKKLKEKGWKFYDRNGVAMCSHPQLGEMETEVALKQRILG